MNSVHQGHPARFVNSLKGDGKQRKDGGMGGIGRNGENSAHQPEKCRLSFISSTLARHFFFFCNKSGVVGSDLAYDRAQEPSIVSLFSKSPLDPTWLLEL